MNDKNILLEQAINGTWWLHSRIDKAMNGQIMVDPILGSDPIAILVYSNNHFAAQFMKRERDHDSIASATKAGSNNTSAVGGYDAYFGTYKTTANSNIVEHTLVASINPSNIGMKVLRELKVVEGKLIIQLETTSVGGDPIIRTLTWDKISR